MRNLTLTSIVFSLLLAACTQQPSQRGAVLITNSLHAHSATVDVYFDGTHTDTLNFTPNGNDVKNYGPQLGQVMCIEMHAPNTHSAYRFTILKGYPYGYGAEVVDYSGVVELKPSADGVAVPQCS
ncbi:hypothetical protein Dgeo_2934 (plasmid) [Deinococcus geothermalis DSM 11300]|uniref:Lipoprotein n=1 Tax=Deinococcus geothermalis (strain DSM 11300 / CIP 105573 / AG-3a) TaxID=319795 RepID=A8ZR68_DEIGD|nr:hypothetical protein Dgeo_2934 [Deinococcus geothermalis DSM 11300]